MFHLLWLKLPTKIRWWETVNNRHCIMMSLLVNGSWHETFVQMWMATMTVFAQIPLLKTDSTPTVNCFTHKVTLVWIHLLLLKLYKGFIYKATTNANILHFLMSYIKKIWTHEIWYKCVHFYRLAAVGCLSQHTRQ